MSENREGLQETTRGAIDVIRHAQQLVHASGDPEAARVIGELDAVASALAVLPDLHAQAERRYAVLFPRDIG